MSQRISTFSLILLLSIFGIGCSTLPNQGVEVGNPNIKGKALTIVPETGDEIYVVEFEDPPEADVTQVIGNEFDTQPVTLGYPEDPETVTVEATFTNGTHMQATIGLNESGDATDVTLMVNGQEIPASFSTETMGLACPGDDENAAITIATTLCSRIVACNTVFACGECEAEVLQVSGLGNQFGGTLNMTLEEVAAGIENGEVEVDQEALGGCLSDMTIIPCALVHEDFNDTDPPNYNGIREIIPKPSCAKGVLKGK